MPLSSTEASKLSDWITAELLRLEPPFLGVNVIRLADLRIFGERMKPVRAQFDDVLSGFQPHFRAITDYGTHKRMLAVNLYGPTVNRDQLRELLTAPQLVADMVAALEVVDDWDFFVAREV